MNSRRLSGPSQIRIAIAILLFFSGSLVSAGGYTPLFQNEHCRQARKLLGNIDSAESLLDDLQQALTDGVSDALADEDLSPAEVSKLEALEDSIAFKDIPNLASAVRRRIAPHLLAALQDLLRDSPMDSGQARLERLSAYIMKLQLPQPPSPPPLAALNNCQQVQAFLKNRAGYVVDWDSWATWDLKRATGAPGKDNPCKALDQDFYAELASQFTSFEAPMAEVGMAIDVLQQSGTVTAAEYYSTLHELASLSLRISERLAKLNRQGNDLYDLEARKKSNLLSNIDKVIEPAYKELCTVKREALKPVPQIGSPVPAPRRYLPDITIFDANVSVQCRASTGQKCSDLWSHEFSSDYPGTIAVVYNGTGNCSPLFFDLWIDRVVRNSTQLVGWSGMPPGNGLTMEVRMVAQNLAPGTHLIQLQAYGEQMGCNSGRLLSYGGRVKLIQTRWVQ